MHLSAARRRTLALFPLGEGGGRRRGFCGRLGGRRLVLLVAQSLGTRGEDGGRNDRRRLGGCLTTCWLAEARGGGLLRLDFGDVWDAQSGLKSWDLEQEHLRHTCKDTGKDAYEDLEQEHLWHTAARARGCARGLFVGCLF